VSNSKGTPTYRFAHNNINVVDIDRAVAFYEQALGLEVVNRRDSEGFTLVFMGDGYSQHKLELTWLKDFDKPRYDLGDNESHLCFTVDDYDASFARHREMDCICYVNEAMGLYFIEDPDGYWIEIVPAKR